MKTIRMKSRLRKSRPEGLAQEQAVTTSTITSTTRTVDDAAVGVETVAIEAVSVESIGVQRDGVEREHITVFVEKVSAEYSRGLHATHEIGPSVTVFGSARTKPGEPAYSAAMNTGRLLAQAGFAVITGGGSGIMEAANRGAALGGGGSIGMPIVLPYEESANTFVGLSVMFDHFPARKTCLIQACDAVIVFVGGFGTLDELFEVLTLMQTGKLARMPVILVGSYYFSGLLEWLAKDAVAAGTINDEDLDLMEVVDSPQRAVELITQRLGSPKQHAARGGFVPTPR
jgi:uncharacterized protein (TIGR00730 family)